MRTRDDATSLPLSFHRPLPCLLPVARWLGFSPVVSDLPPIRVHYPHVEARPDLLAGSPLVRGTKVPVRRLWAWHRKGVTVETLVKRYPAIGPAKVLCALAFAYDNQDVLEADLERERAMLDAEAEKVPGAMEQTRLPFGSRPPGRPRGRVRHVGRRARASAIP